MGYHLYAIACQRAVDKGKIAKHLPDDAITITFDWKRYYSEEELIDLLSSPFFELVQSRISLIATTSVFDAALTKFIRRLNDMRLIDRHQLPRNYRDRIEWAYRASLKSNVGRKETLERLPMTFGMLDNARRLRNLITHNNGIFDMQYETSAITSDDIQVQLHPDFERFKENPEELIPVVITSEELLRFIWAHIEVLHVLHNHLQKTFFGVDDGYSYEREEKPIEWRSMLLGGSKVRISFKDHVI